MKQWPLSTVIKQMKEEHSFLSQLNNVANDVQVLLSSVNCVTRADVCDVNSVLAVKILIIVITIKENCVYKYGIVGYLTSSPNTKNDDHFHTKYMFTKQFINCCNLMYTLFIKYTLQFR